ncbi:nucleotidyltransferase family protein [Endomicrobium sp. AH-315-J14]|nr:nucleotidyltransferase family protein [Endomicrobium sp. AH-315-J14]
MPLRRAFDDPSILLGDPAGAQAQHLLRGHVLTRFDKLLTGQHVALVKGAGLGELYPEPWQRTMADVDLLVEQAELEAVVDILVESGCRRHRRLPEARTLTDSLMHEVCVTAEAGNAELLIEVHDSLDKVVERPIDYRAILERARPAPGFENLLVPTAEDHLLLVALHLANSDFQHEIGWVDLARMLRTDLDWRVIDDRARQWRMTTAVYIVLKTLVSMGEPIDEAVLDRLRPSRLRQEVLSLCYRIGSYPVFEGEPTLGLPWVMRQTPLRDDLSHWLSGIASYSAKRVLERL